MRKPQTGKYLVLLLFVAAALGFYRWKDAYGITGSIQRLDFDTNGHIAFVRQSADGTTDLYLVDAAGGSEPRKLSDRSGAKRAPAWSPDGTRLCYAAETKADGHSTFQVYLVGGSGALQATYGSVGKDAPMWSPDGSRIAFLAGGAVKVMRSNGSDLEQLFPRPRSGNAPTEQEGHEGHDHGDEGSEAAEGMKQPPIGSYRWAPSGTNIVALQVIEGEMAAAMGRSNWWQQDGQDAQPDAPPMMVPEPERLLVIPGLTDDVRPLPGATANRITYAWFPDGKRVAVALSTRMGNHAVGVWRVDELHLQPTIVFASTGGLMAAENPSVSPDGQRVAVEMWRTDGEGNRIPMGIAVLSAADGAGLRVMQAADVAKVPLAVKGPASRPQWSPDGKRLMYLLAGPAGRDIWVAAPDGSSAVNLTKGEGDNFDAVWSPRP